MAISQVTLVNFRNFQEAQFRFCLGVNLVVGPNASGKTNLLEAIHLLGSTTSFREAKICHLIHWKANKGKVEGLIDSSTKLAIVLTPGKKEFFQNDKRVRRKQFRAFFTTVVFRPEDIRLITGSPNRRRRVLNHLLASLDWEYEAALKRYQQALAQRNQLLDELREGTTSATSLFFWDQVLIKNGRIIQQKRADFFDFVNYFWQTAHQGKFAALTIKYQPSIITTPKLKDNLPLDLKTGATQIGPHRDEFYFLNRNQPTNNQNLAFFGSRGQQRLAALGFRLAQLAFVEEKTGKAPTLLVDDIFSELDEKTSKLLTKVFTRYQTLLTAVTPPPFLPAETVLSLSSLLSAVHK